MPNERFRDEASHIYRALFGGEAEQGSKVSTISSTRSSARSSRADVRGTQRLADTFSAAGTRHQNIAWCR